MSNISDDLQDFINKLVIEKTFNLEAVTQIQEIKKALDGALRELELAKVNINSLNERNKFLAQEIETKNARIQALEKNEAVVDERFRNVTKLEIEKACAEKMQATTLGMFNIVFANAALKTSIMREVVTPVPGQSYNSRDHVREEKTEEKG